MKQTAFILLLVVFAGSVQAQTPRPSSKEKMAPLAAWAGKWKGEGSMTMPNGETKKSSVDETVQVKLDNTLIMLEGVGKAIDPATQKEIIVHQALGIVSFDPYSNKYKLKTYLHDGKSGEAWFTVLGENRYQWGYEIPNGKKTRYTIELNPEKKTWYEFGEDSKDGTTWNKFFEMSLTKVE
ncbi:MAG TPA: hypothetical protein VEB86_12955 [Chryseosolibacter sp.]|nr:hypothetical protein [Chryseosolibacter sp.]